MKLIRMMSFVALSLFCSSTLATGAGWYFGVGVGATNTNNTDRTLTVLNPPPTTIDATAKNTGIGGRIFTGYNINPFFAFEGGLTRYGDTTYNIPSGVQVSAGNSPSIHTVGLDLEGKAMVAVWNLSWFFKGGMTVLSATSSGVLHNPPSTIPPATTSGSSNKATNIVVRPLVGVGLSYDFTQNWVGDISWTTSLGGGTVRRASMIALSVSYHIVDVYCGQFLC